MSGEVQVTLPNPRIRQPFEVTDSPFLPLGQATRLAFLFYLFAYRIVLPLMAALMSDGAKDLLALRFTAQLFYTVLLAYPFIFYRREYGWLHPLVLPTVYAIGKAAAKDPFSLIMPLNSPTVDFDVETYSRAVALSLPNLDLAWLRLKLTLVQCAAQTVYLLVFLFGPKFTIPDIDFRTPKNVPIVSMAFVVILAGISSIFVISQGGISQLLVAMRGGRVSLFNGEGQFLFAGVATTTIMLAWFMYEKRPWTNPMFLGGLMLSLLVSIITTGSRSSVVMPVIGLLLLWWKRRNKVLIAPTLGVAAFGLVVIGAFGAIRQDYASTSVDFSVLNPLTYGNSIGRALDDIQNRDDEESDLAALAGAEQGLMWGETYLNGVTFWIPRAMWADKPRTADAYNFWYNFSGNLRTTELRDWGIWGAPVSAEVEAYWNYWWPGVIMLGFFMGMLHATLAKAAYRYGKVAFFWAFYLLVLTRFSGTGKEFAEMVRNCLLLYMFAYVAGIFRFSSPQAQRIRMQRQGS